MVESILVNKKLKSIKENLLQKTANNCWNCIYHIKGGINLLGRCNWWFLHEKQAPKEIPNTIIDKGCKFWQENNDSFHPLLEVAIKKFKGTLIE